MNRKIKLIWDFRGPDAQITAQHHEKHLKEYIDARALPIKITGTDRLGEAHATAWMVVEESSMIPVRDALRPHRGELFQD